MEEGGLWWFWLVALVDYKIMSSSFCVVTHGLSISKVPMCKYSRGITQYCCVIVGFPNRQADRHTMIIGNHEQTSLSTSRNMEATVQERHYPHTPASPNRKHAQAQDARPGSYTGTSERALYTLLALDPAERIRVPGPLGYTKATRLQKLYAARLR